MRNLGVIVMFMVIYSLYISIYYIINEMTVIRVMSVDGVAQLVEALR